MTAWNAAAGTVLGQCLGDIDTEPVRTAVRPEAQGRVEVLTDLRVVPVNVGLFGGKEVQVPLARRSGGRPGCFGDSGAGRTADVQRPVRGR